MKKYIIKPLTVITVFILCSHSISAQQLPELIPFNENGLFGYCDSNLNVIITAKYQKVYPFSENRAAVTLNNLNGYIDNKGNQITPCIYKSNNAFFQGFTLVKSIDQEEVEVIEIETMFGSYNNDKPSNTYINTKGEVAKEPFEWERLKRNYNENNQDYLFFGNNGKHGVIDKNGTIIVPLKYSQTHQITKDGIAVFEHNGKHIITNSKGEEILRTDNISHIKENRFFFNGNRSEGYMTIYGDTISSSEYDYPYYSECYSTTDNYDKEFRGFFEGRAIVKGKKGQGYIDLKGHLIIDTIYDVAFNFKEGRAKVKRNGKYGFIDKEGNLIGELKYDQVCYFYNGMAQVIIGDKCGYINLKGEEVIPLIYDYWQGEEYASFNKNLVRVRRNEKFGILNKKGETVVELKYDDIAPFYNTCAIVKLEDKYGLINEKGVEIIPPTHKILSRLDSYALMSTNGPNNRQYGLINLSGEILLSNLKNRPSRDHEFKSGIYKIINSTRNYYFIDKYGTKYLK